MRNRISLKTLLFKVNIKTYLKYKILLLVLIIYFQLCLVLKRAKKSKNDLINAEEGEDHFTDISSVGKL